MHITLRDPAPVQKTYMFIPKPLHAEVKEHLQDLLNKGWITPSRSPYSSPVVCVRKKDGGLRLCCDYRELNSKSVPDRHPIPRIQDMLDSLSGSSWFQSLHNYFCFSPSVNVVDFCGQTIHKDGLIINSHQDSKKYYFVTTGTDCHFTMRANMLQDRVLFNFRFFLVYSLLRVTPLSPPPLFQESASDPSLTRPVWPDQHVESTLKENNEDPCYTGSYIQFYDGPSKNSPRLGLPLCGKSPPQPVLSTGNYLTLRLVTRGTQPRVDFVGDFTSFRLGSNQSGCGNELYFSCWNGKCIPISLVCNDDQDIDNCGDGSDLRSHHEAICTS
ncbi:hypothetical protein ACEWY4_013870 [Coilia grayii]|uniref:CUB domain-containing protein n=1 Tax=Coilia grayii TaxID=363190 RepID=A0ABD1JXJ0_9TELE